MTSRTQIDRVRRASREGRELLLSGPHLAQPHRCGVPEQRMSERPAHGFLGSQSFEPCDSRELNRVAPSPVTPQLTPLLLPACSLGWVKSEPPTFGSTRYDAMKRDPSLVAYDASGVAVE